MCAQWTLIICKNKTNYNRFSGIVLGCPSKVKEFVIVYKKWRLLIPYFYATIQLPLIQIVLLWTEMVSVSILVILFLLEFELYM